MVPASKEPSITQSAPAACFWDITGIPNSTISDYRNSPPLMAAATSRTAEN
jgi:hypothetical protein